MSDRFTRPEWQRSALLTIDVQRDFIRPNEMLTLEGTTGPIQAMQNLTKVFRSAKLPIVHVVRIYLADGSNVDVCRRAMIEDGGQIAVPGTEGMLVAEELLPQLEIHLDSEGLLQGEVQLISENEWVVYKPRWSAFFNTCLKEHLRSLDITTVVVCGLNFPNCPRTTIYEATALDFRVVAVSDAISGVYDRGLKELNGIGVLTLDSTEAVSIVTSTMNKVT